MEHCRPLSQGARTANNLEGYYKHAYGAHFCCDQPRFDGDGDAVGERTEHRVPVVDMASQILIDNVAPTPSARRCA